MSYHLAVLSKFKDSIRELQKYFILNWKGASLPDTIKIETVDRVQGLTVDYCIFFIPNASLPYSLDPKLFNVATSRARLNTIIVADSTMLQRQMSDDVRKYILKAHEEQFVEFLKPVLSFVTNLLWYCSFVLLQDHCI